MRQERPAILLVDDEEKILVSLAGILEKNGFQVTATVDGNRALHLIEQNPIDVVILDLVMPGLDGMTVLKTLRERKPSLPVIMLTGHGTIARAVESIKLGAFDFLEKPVEVEKILVTLQNALEKSRLARERDILIKDALERYQMIGVSKPLREIFAIIEKVAPADSRVLISGESGTGKELVARAIHLRSRRAGGPFCVVNCAAIPDDLIESELFGYEKGAFTGAVCSKPGKFELASRGTLFLDEVGDMSLKVQAKVLRAIEEGKIQRLGGDKTISVDARILAASNRNLKKAVGERLFREDLFFRLSVINIHIPPLRERKEDIPFLLDFFLKQFCEERKRPIMRLDSSALELLLQYPWPGNVRELRNFVEKIVVLSLSEQVSSEEVKSILGESSADALQSCSWKLMDVRKKAERDFILTKLIATGWNYEKTAQELGISRATLFNKLRDYNIKREGNYSANR